MLLVLVVFSPATIGSFEKKFFEGERLNLIRCQLGCSWHGIRLIDSEKNLTLSFALATAKLISLEWQLVDELMAVLADSVPRCFGIFGDILAPK